MDANTKAYLDRKFAASKRRDQAARKAQRDIVAGTTELLEVVADIEGLTQSTRQRVTAAKGKVLDAIPNSQPLTRTTSGTTRREPLPTLGRRLRRARRDPR